MCIILISNNFYATLNLIRGITMQEQIIENHQKIQSLLASAQKWIEENNTAYPSNLNLIKMDVNSLNDLNKINEQLKSDLVGEKIIQVSKLVDAIQNNYNKTIHRCSGTNTSQSFTNAKSTAEILAKKRLFTYNQPITERQNLSEAATYRNQNT